MIDIPGKGKDVVAKLNTDKESYICEYTGEIISYEEAKTREEKYLSDHDNKGLDYRGYIFFFYHCGKKLREETVMQCYNNAILFIFLPTKVLMQLMRRMYQEDTTITPGKVQTFSQGLYQPRI